MVVVGALVVVGASELVAGAEVLVTAAAALLGGVSPNVVVVAVRSGFAGRGTITMLGAVLSIGYANAAGSSVSVVVLVALRRSAASNGFAVSMSGAARRSWSPTAAAIAT